MPINKKQYAKAVGKDFRLMTYQENTMQGNAERSFVF